MWQEFAEHIFYCRGDLTDAAAYQKLEQQLAAFGSEPLRQNLLFYLATLPSQFGQVVEQVASGRSAAQTRTADGWQRIVVEKPFGHDLASAHQLNRELTRFAGEQQVFRIDHYLGKETVQNILMFRFSNAIFERLWNRDSIDHLQITVSEKHGRGPARRLLRGSRRLARHGAEPPLAGPVAHRDGAAGVARCRVHPGREGQAAQVHPCPDPGRCRPAGSARAVFRGDGGR